MDTATKEDTIEEDIITFSEGNAKYIKSYSDNMRTNKAAGIYDADNVFSVRGLTKEIRNNYEKCLFINPGSSTDKHIDAIIEMSQQKDVCVICSDVCVIGLLSKGVKIDYVVTLDPNPICAHFFSAAGVSDLNVICSSASAISAFYTTDKKYLLFNSVEEKVGIFRYIYREEFEKSEEVLKSFREAQKKSAQISQVIGECGIGSKYHDLLARGTVSVTLYQLAVMIRIESHFYGFNFSVKKNEPYAKFISEANHKHLKTVLETVSKLSLKAYKLRIMNSYFNGTYDPKIFDRIEHSLQEAPLLSFYKKLLVDYMHIDKMPTDKLFKFY